ncbi:STAS domain-containing protein [Dactylosporangium fulvum]|uniref:Anti-sigma factor antagonist n=1 Tax=Dactylosporangium fulvum TaxID=53359 RepID=A0ABY5W4G1_9ACTN|nr:STAS domain-containing protein [Dactylosporangium fulvum]UWP84953.1 STAS domain-containing protein [Dactylosporangium fulvum]
MDQVDRFAVFPELHITVDPLPNRAIRVRVAGEITVENVAQLRTVLFRAIDDVRATAVEVDVSLVTFIDSTGIGKLVGARAHARGNNSDLWIVNPSPGVRRVLSLLGLLDALSGPPAGRERPAAGWAPPKSA